MEGRRRKTASFPFYSQRSTKGRANGADTNFSSSSSLLVKCLDKVRIPRRRRQQEQRNDGGRRKGGGRGKGLFCLDLVGSRRLLLSRVANPRPSCSCLIHCFFPSPFLCTDDPRVYFIFRRTSVRPSVSPIFSLDFLPPSLLARALMLNTSDLISPPPPPPPAGSTQRGRKLVLIWDPQPS